MWNGRVLLTVSRLVAILLMYLTCIYHSKICISSYAFVNYPVMSNHIRTYTWVSIIF